MSNNLMINGVEHRYLLHHLGFSREENVDEPLRSAIRRFDEFVVPIVYGENPSDATSLRASMAAKLIAKLLNQDAETITKVIDAAIEEMRDYRGKFREIPKISDVE